MLFLSFIEAGDDSTRRDLLTEIPIDLLRDPRQVKSLGQNFQAPHFRSRDNCEH